MPKSILKLSLLMSVWLFACVLPAAAQQQSISGTVTEAETGNPLAGVNIRVLGTTIGTATNGMGEYSISVPDSVTTLTFSFIGFKTKQVPIDGRSTINVTMKEQVFAGEELVVVGYGSQQAEDLTGSISSVDSSAISKQPALTATEALQGKVAGVNITRNDAPGGTPTVIVRGLGTALGGRNPLYIVDGVPANDINNISPNDIKSIDFLKDAASASIYGLRAANGVIIVTTKNGEAGKPTLSVDAYTGYNFVLNDVEMAGPQEYVNYFNEENAAIEQYLGNDTYQLQPASEQPYSTDWYDELISPGLVVNTTAAVSGGSDKVNYYFSYNLNKEEGLLDGQDFWRQTIRSNNDFTLFDGFLDIKQNLNLSFSKENSKPFGAFNDAYRQSPLVPVRYPNGRFGQSLVNQTTGLVGMEATPAQTLGRLNDVGNPVVGVDLTNEENRTIQLQGNVSAVLHLTENLDFTSRLGATKFWRNYRNYIPTREFYLANNPLITPEQFQALQDGSPDATNFANNELFIEKQETLRWNWDNFFNYRNDFGDHSFDVTAGMSSERVGVGDFLNGRAYDVPEQEQYWSLNLASDQYESQLEQLNYTPTTLLSYFGRVAYNYDSRYYLSGTLRRDGSSRFANNEDYYGLFPSVAAAWTISNEDFMSDESFINFLKLRASFGKLGNQNVPFNTTTVSTSVGSGTQNYVFGPNQRLVQGAIVTSPARNISWEIVKEYNAGADYRLLDNRLSGSIDVYQKTTQNVILQIDPVPSSQFGGDFFDEGGEVRNRGIEFVANWSDQLTDDFSYNVGFNISYNKNEVRNVTPGYEGQTGGDLGNGFLTKRLAEGQPIGAWWMYEADGVWQTQEEIANNASIGGATPGHLRYVDQNNDGVIDDRDRKYFGSYVPNYNYGINAGVNYKQIDFSVDAFGVAGNKVYNGLKSARRGGYNVPQEFYEDRWTGPGSTNDAPGAYRDNVPSSYYLEDGDFFRINNITLGYTFTQLVERVSSLRFYVSAQNPFIFTGYSGFTPELIGNQGGDPYGLSGIERNAYPNTRTFLFGINVDFK